jgi:RNA polymerase sigma-70 factor (ECF subfamily)
MEFPARCLLLVSVRPLTGSFLTVPIHRLSDSRLVRRSQQGDRDAFVALVQRYDSRLRGLVYGLVANGEAMDRVLRVAYLKAWRDVVRADPDDDAGTWLYRTVYNACIDELRRESRRLEGPGSGPAAALDDPVIRALAGLPPEERVAAVLVDREGFSLEGAARILGLAPDTFATRLAAARTRLAGVVPARRPRPRPRPTRGPGGGGKAGGKAEAAAPRTADRKPEPAADPAGGADAGGDGDADGDADRPLAAAPRPPAAGASNRSPSPEKASPIASDRPATVPDIPAAAARPVAGPASGTAPVTPPQPPGSLPT